MSTDNCTRCDRPWSEHGPRTVCEGHEFGSYEADGKTWCAYCGDKPPKRPVVQEQSVCPVPAVDWRARALAAEAAARGAPSTRAVCPCGCVLGWKFNGGNPGWFVMGACERCALPAHEVLP